MVESESAPRQEAKSARRVLIVDDNVDAAETLAEFLVILGHEVRTANDGPRALAVAGEWRADLVLLDIGLPGMNGFEVARALRLLPLPPGSVVALSGYGLEGDGLRSAAAAFDQHLLKPVEISKLEALLLATRAAH